MSKVNVVIEGVLKDRGVRIYNNSLIIGGQNVSKNTVSSYEIVDESNKNSYSFLKGAIGVALLGGIGGVAGLSKKKEYLVVVNWIYPKNRQDNRSLILIDEKCYKALIKSMF